MRIWDHSRERSPGKQEDIFYGGNPRNLLCCKSMIQFKIAVIAGDGIGKEVTPEGLRVLERLGPSHQAEFVLTHYEWGSEYYFQHGRMMPVNALDQLRSADAIYLGAVGHPDL